MDRVWFSDRQRLTSSFSIAKHGIGWGGWTRTNTVLINSEVSYQLDHAPTGFHILIWNVREPLRKSSRRSIDFPIGGSAERTGYYTSAV